MLNNLSAIDFKPNFDTQVKNALSGTEQQQMEVMLSKAGWKKHQGGLYWQSPYNGLYFSPVRAVNEEARWRKS